jgi:glycerol-3-phosphate dehydrogenase
MVPLVRVKNKTPRTASNLYCESYIGQDPIGVELAGALKNVYAIAAGIADGLGFENNTRASKL